MSDTPRVKAKPGRAKSGIAFVGVGLDPATGRTLRQLAADQDTQIRTLVAQGLHYILLKYRRPVSPELIRIASGE